MQTLTFIKLAYYTAIHTFYNADPLKSLPVASMVAVVSFGAYFWQRLPKKRAVR